MVLDDDLKNAILTAQKNEMTEYEIYKRLGDQEKVQANKEVLYRIGEDELKHYHFWKKFTKQDVQPKRFKIWRYVMMAKILSLSFSLKLMERGEEFAQEGYRKLKALDPHIENVMKEEARHERRLLQMIDEEQLKYTGSIILGLNDAIVELTGALAGFTLALQHTRVIAMAGVIIGVAASLSMAASEYLSTKEEKSDKNPLKASIYTGIAYIMVVVLLTIPYFIFTRPLVCLGVTLGLAVFVIFIFNYYISVAKELSFKKRFVEMLSISLGVAILNFFVGMIAREYLAIDI